MSEYQTEEDIDLFAINANRVLSDRHYNKERKCYEKNQKQTGDDTDADAHLHIT